MNKSQLRRVVSYSFLHRLMAILISTFMSVCVFADAHNNAHQQKPVERKDFIMGFLKGALLTDTAILDNLTSDNETGAFFDRAYKTRLGRKLQDLPVTFYANFCLPEVLSIGQVTDQILSDVKAVNDATLGEEVFRSLQQRYPCEVQ